MALKAILDVIFGVLLAITFFTDTFRYMKFIYVSLTAIRFDYDLPIPSSSIPGCDGLFTNQVCESLEKCSDAAEVFTWLAGVTAVLLVLSILSFLNSVYRLKIKVLKFQGYHILYPLVYTAAFFSYLLVSKMYSLSDYGLGEDFQVTAENGLILMYACQGISLLSLVIFFVSKLPCMAPLEEHLL